MKPRFILELERGDTRTALYLHPDGETVTPEPSKAAYFDCDVCAQTVARAATIERDTVGERFVLKSY